MTSAVFEQGHSVSVDIEGADPQAIRANKLELVERFADDLAHEIKNPLHSMVINLEVLKRRITRDGGSPPEELMRYANVLGSELERVNRRIELLFRLVRPERSVEMTSLPAAVDELLELLELERDRRRVQIEFSPAPIPVRGHITREAARQLVLNLLLDALSLVRPGGALGIRTEVESNWIHLLFEGETAAGAGGDGGEPSAPHLAIARALADAHNGRLELRGAAPGESFVITLSLPLTTPA